MQQVPVIPGGMTPDQDNAAALHPLQEAGQVIKGMGQNLYDVSPPGIFKSYMQQKFPNAKVPLPESAPLKDFPQNATMFGLSMMAGGEGEVEGAIKPRVSPAPEAIPSPASSGVSLGSVLARHIPVVGRYLRTIDDIQSLLGKDAPHPTTATNVAAARSAPIPETNGIQWGTGGQGPLDLRGKMIPDVQSPYQVQNIPVQGAKVPAVQGSTPGMPEMQPSQSTTIAQHGYDPVKQQMTVQFKNGNVYSYSGVPQKVYDQYQASESQGSFHANNIKGRYMTNLIGKVKPTPGQKVAQALGGSQQ